MDANGSKVFPQEAARFLRTLLHGWVDRDMKPLGHFRPEPPPKAEFWKICLALAMLVLAIGVALYGFHAAGAITDTVFLAVMVFVVAVCAGVILALDMERQAHRDVPIPFREVPPPFDFSIVWPPSASAEDQKSSNEADEEGHGRTPRKGRRDEQQ